MAHPAAVWSHQMQTVEMTVFSNGTAEVALDRPEKSNAFNEAMWVEFRQAFELLAKRDDVRAVVVCGRGKNFTAGIDLSFFAASFAAVGGGSSAGSSGSGGGGGSESCPARLRHRKRREVLEMQECFNAVERLPWPVLAAVHGACVGAGVDLITACDMRYCASDAHFTVKEVDVGITADLGTLQRLPPIVGHGAAADLALTARRVDAGEALSLGLVSRVLPDPEGLMAAARGAAAALAAKSPLALAGTKRVLLHARDHPRVAGGLEYVATWNAGMLVESSDARESLRAAQARERPRYSKL